MYRLRSFPGTMVFYKNISVEIYIIKACQLKYSNYMPSINPIPEGGCVCVWGGIKRPTVMVLGLQFYSLA